MGGRALLFVLLLLLASACGAAPARPLAPRPSPPAPAPAPALVSIAVGGAHTCALVSDGRVLCFGDDRFGQLGDAEPGEGRAAPLPVRGVTDAVAIASGARHACALARTGEVRCWGHPFGALPVVIEDVVNATAIASGERSCAVHRGGEVACWPGDAAPPGAPARAAPVAGLTGAVGVVAATHACALLREGSVWCWGRNDLGQLGEIGGAHLERPVQVPGLRGVVALAAGAAHTCALGGDGLVRCFGFDRFGQLGSGPPHEPRTEPRMVEGLRDIRLLAAGGHVTCAVGARGESFCWGENVHGQLGVSIEVPEPGGAVAPHRARPARVEGLAGARMLSTGGDHTCALGPRDELRCFGLNDHGQLGTEPVLDRLRPTAVMDLEGVVDVALGHGYTCARTREGRVACWGGFAPGFDPDLNGDRVFVPVTGAPIDVTGLTGPVELVAGINHGCALHPDGGVRCWGRNETAQVARRRWSDLRFDAVRVPAVRARGLSAGGFHTCALVGRGLRCWGGVNGDVAGNAITARPSPIGGLGAVVEVAAGRRHTCARAPSGAVRCFGDGWYGALGPRFEARPGARSRRPVLVEGLPPAAQISVGEHHACARAHDGTVRCWGGFAHEADATGELVPVAAPVPVRIEGIDDAVEVACGGSHTCVRHASGSVSCFGANHRGQLGDGTRAYRAVPTPVVELAGAVQVAAGATHSCARLADLTLRCWGDNRAAAIGDGAVAYRARPVVVALDLSAAGAEPGK